MSVTLSPPVRVAALVSALVLTGIGAFVFLLGARSQDESVTPVAPAAQAVKAPAKPHATAPKPAKAKAVKHPLNPALPIPVAKALRNRQVVVVAVYIPGAAVDSFVRREARAGARMATAAFVPVSASSGNALDKIVAKTGVLPAPAVVIYKRPGVVVSTLGVADRETVAAAVAQAKSGK